MTRFGYFLGSSVVSLFILAACKGVIEEAPSESKRTREISADSRRSCIDFTNRGLLKGEFRSDLLDMATSDAKADERKLAFYKSLPSPKPSHRYYVFSVSNITDFYRVYLVDEEKGRLVVKFSLGSLHYAPNLSDCTFPGL